MMEGQCLYCDGDGMDPYADYLLPCPHCAGTGERDDDATAEAGPLPEGA